MTIEQLTELILEQAKAKGFGITPEEINVPEKIALIHSEISEAYSAWRKKNIDGQGGFNEEIADSIIRLLHLAGVMGVDVENEVLKKIKSNDGRNWDWEKLNESHT